MCDKHKNNNNNQGFASNAFIVLVLFVLVAIILGAVIY